MRVRQRRSFSTPGKSKVGRHSRDADSLEEIVFFEQRLRADAREIRVPRDSYGHRAAPGSHLRRLSCFGWQRGHIAWAGTHDRARMIPARCPVVGTATRAMIGRVACLARVVQDGDTMVQYSHDFAGDRIEDAGMRRLIDGGAFAYAAFYTRGAIDRLARNPRFPETAQWFLLRRVRLSFANSRAARSAARILGEAGLAARIAKGEVLTVAPWVVIAALTIRANARTVTMESAHVAEKPSARAKRRPPRALSGPGRPP